MLQWKGLTMAQALRVFRESRGISARALSVKAGLSNSYVGKLEAGSLDPSVRSVAALCIALDLSNEEIFFLMRCMIAEERAAISVKNGEAIYLL